MRTSIALAMVLAVATASAAPVSLFCRGKMATGLWKQPEGEQSGTDIKNAVIGITVDKSTHKITVNNDTFEFEDTFGSSIIIINTQHGKDLLINLDSVTGMLQFSIDEHIGRGTIFTRIFDGICKPAQKLF